MNTKKIVIKKRQPVVAKALSDEERSMLSNIESIVQELTAMSAGGQEAQAGMGMEEEAPAAPAMAPVKKAIENTPGDTADADSPAEQRIGDAIPETTEDNVKEVAKALLQIAGIRKSQEAKPVDPVLKSLNDLAAEVKKIHTNNEAVANAVAGLMGHMGLAKSIESEYERVKKSNESAQQKGIPETLRFMNELVDTINKSRQGAQQAAPAPAGSSEAQIGVTHASQQDAVHKNLTGLLKGGLFSGPAQSTFIRQ